MSTHRSRSAPASRLSAATSCAAWLLSAALGAQAAPSSSPGPAPAAIDEAAPPPARGASAVAWCAPELESLPRDVCVALPAGASAPPRELVIFLHGVIAPGDRWQWAQQRGAARAATALGFAVLMPPGRQAIRTDSMRHWFTWPTSARAQRQVEHDVLAQWLEARRAVELRIGRAFERTYVVGFSNGAYYVSSLALRGRLPVDGYAAFAGGVAPGPIRPSAYAEVARVPFYVGYGMADDPARRDCATLAPLFRALKWPGKVVGSRGVGHEVTDAQWKAAIGYFRAERPLDEPARPSSVLPALPPPSG